MKIRLKSMFIVNILMLSICHINNDDILTNIPPINEPHLYTSAY